MTNRVITFVIDTLEPDLDHILAAAINEIHGAGHTLKEVRLADDSGEVKVAPNTVAGVTPPEEEVPAEETASVEAPADPVVPPEDTPATA